MCCRTSSDKPAGEWDRIARKTTQKFDKASHPIFYCAEPFLKLDLKSKKGKSTIQTKTIDVRTILAFFNDVFAPQCVSGLIKTIKTKELVIVSHKFDPPPRLNCFGRLNARQQRPQDHCSRVKRCRFPTRSWKRPKLCDQTLNQKRRTMDTCLQSVRKNHSKIHVVKNIK